MSFARDLALLCQRAGDKAELVVRKTALDLYGQMIERSPVGNPDLWKSPAPEGYTGGRFKNNWQVGVGVLNDDTSREPSAQGGGALGAFDAAIRTWKPGQTIWMTNSMPYAKKLEYGHSKQAPGGMVRLAVQNYSQAIKKAADQVRGT